MDPKNFMPPQRKGSKVPIYIAILIVLGILAIAIF